MIINLLVQNIPYIARTQFINGCQNIRKDVQYLKKVHPIVFSWIENIDEVVDVLALGLFYRTIIAPLNSGASFYNNLSRYGNTEINSDKSVLIGEKKLTRADSQRLSIIYNEFLKIMRLFGLNKTFLNTSDTNAALRLYRQR